MMEMQTGKIYHISYGGGTDVVARFKESDCTVHNFFSHLHYWNGYENYYSKGHCVKDGIESIREASPAEKHNLFRHEVKKGDV